MAKGGWLSNSVFQTFYARTRLQNVSLDKIRQTNTGPVATDKEGQSSARAAQSDTPNSGTPADSIAGAETTYKLGPHGVDCRGIELEIPGSGMKNGVRCYCHACWGADTSTLLYCKSCNNTCIRDILKILKNQLPSSDHKVGSVTNVNDRFLFFGVSPRLIPTCYDLGFRSQPQGASLTSP